MHGLDDHVAPAFWHGQRYRVYYWSLQALRARFNMHIQFNVLACSFISITMSVYSSSVY